ALLLEEARLAQSNIRIRWFLRYRTYERGMGLVRLLRSLKPGQPCETLGIARAIEGPLLEQERGIVGAVLFQQCVGFEGDPFLRRLFTFAPCLPESLKLREFIRFDLEPSDGERGALVFGENIEVAFVKLPEFRHVACLLRRG